MKKMILHITPDFNYSCGRSKYVFLCLKYFSNNKNFEVHFITNGGDSLDRLKEISLVKFKVMTFSKGINNILYKKKFYRDLKNYVSQNKIELIHTHHRFPELISVKIAKELNIKTITSVHSLVTGYKKISYRSDKMISVSKFISSHLKKNFNVDPEKIITLYNPLEKFPEVTAEEKEKLKTKIGIKPGQKVLLFMGRVSKKKGADTLLKSFYILKERTKDVVLLICGSLEDNTTIKNNSNIIMIPSNPNNYVFYSIADIVVLPSRMETLSFVMLESGLCKKPFIGGKAGGIAEFIKDGEDGLLVNPENPDELAEKIIYLLNNKDISAQLGNNLYKKVKDNCDYDIYFNKLEEIYNSLFK